MQMLLIRRAKEPFKGEWCVPGGGQELGESLQECAVREVLEETGIALRWNPDRASLTGLELDSPDYQSLSSPSIITCVDSIIRDADGVPLYHYTIVEVPYNQ